MFQKEKKDLKLFYSISEVAQIFSVNESLLRYWEKEFPQISPNKTSGGTRQYRKEDIDTIKLVYYLVKEKGMTLPGARQQLAHNKEMTTRNFEVLTKLKEIREELYSIRKELDRYPNSQEQKDENLD